MAAAAPTPAHINAIQQAWPLPARAVQRDYFYKEDIAAACGFVRGAASS
ncbi:MAG: hypothetical protein WCH44_07475 [Betaproteobacteria bacterium]